MIGIAINSVASYDLHRDMVYSILYAFFFGVIFTRIHHRKKRVAWYLPGVSWFVIFSISFQIVRASYMEYFPPEYCIVDEYILRPWMRL